MDKQSYHNPPATPHLLQTGELLINKDIITREQFEAAMTHQAERSPASRIGNIVVELGFASARDVIRVIAEQAGCPFTVVTPQLSSPEALSVLPAAFIERHNLLPLRVAEGWLTIAMESFNDPFLLDEISHRSGMRVQAIAAAPEDILEARRAMELDHESLAAAPLADQDRSLDSILGQIGMDDLQVVEDYFDDESNLDVTAAESPIVKLVNYIIQHGVQNMASDIHIEPDGSAFRVRYRIDGDLVPGVTPPRRLLPAVVSRIKILSGMDISERRMPQDGGVTVKLESRAIDLRVSTMATRQGEKVVMRIIDREADVPTLDRLGLHGPMLSTMRSIARMPNGLVLVTGPTGSGKSTTLYSVLAEVTNDLRNTSTIEDPVERRLPGVNQFQIRAKAGFTFAMALRSLLRQDPDVIMVGEIRDAETAMLAIEASLTGHLVLSTLHTNDAESAIPRLVNMGVERYMIAATLRGVLAQRLVRRVCRECRKIVAPDQSQRQILSAACGGVCPIESASCGVGCPRCHGRGSIGRIGVFDMLVMNEEILSSMLEASGPIDPMRLGTQSGPPGLLADVIRKAEQGEIGLDSLIQFISHIETPERGTAVLGEAACEAG